jgi:methyl-accepting chemotaxis protein
MHAFRNLPVRWKLLFGFGLVLLIAVGQSVFAYRATSRSLETNHWVEHTYQVLRLADEARAAMVNMEAGFRGFLVTGREEFLEPYHEGRRTVAERLAALRRETADNPEQVRRWEQIEARAGDWQQAVVEPGLALRRAVTAGRARMEDVVRFLSTGEGKKRLDGIRALFAEAAGVERGLLERRNRDQDAAAAFLLQLLVWGTLLMVGLGLGLGVLLAGMVSRPLHAAVRALEALAAGDVTQRLSVDTRDEVGRMAAALNQAVESMRSALLAVRATATEVATAAGQLSAASEELAAGSQEQASSLEQTAASLEEITGTVKQTADNARVASQVAADSREQAQKGGKVVAAAVGAMNEINQASKKIAEIITTIDEIAFQTNLLALNAAVEAARAGEQGRGFAVVAGEVRNLAQRSAAAAKEIKALIQDSVARVEAGTGLVTQSGQTLEEIVTSAKRVADLVAEIAAACQEQSTGIDQVNRAVTQMDQVTQKTAAQTEELASTAQAMAGQAQRLQALVGQFRLEAAATPGPAEAPAPAASRPAPSAPRPGTPAPRAAAPRPAPRPVLAHVGPGNNSAGGREDETEEF